jgi:hypothetical protein
VGKRKKIPEVAPWTPPKWLSSNLLPADADDADTTPRLIVGMGTFSDAELTVRKVTGALTTKRYDCPLCNQAIEIGTPHVVVIPNESPDLRRHFHTPCWNRRNGKR